MAPSSTCPSSNSPCAACKFLRRKCMTGCIFAPYFLPEEPNKFAGVHKIFGASNVAKLLNELHPSQREDAVNSLAYEAEARMKDPVYGCVGAISILQRQVQRLQKELEAANADLLRHACNQLPTPMPLPVVAPPLIPCTYPRLEYCIGSVGGGGGFFHPARQGTQPFLLPYHSSPAQWSTVAGNQQVEQHNGGDLLLGMWVGEREDERALRAACDDQAK